MGYRGQGGGGVRWSRGGAKRRKNSINIDFNGFAVYAEKLEELEANVKDVFTEVMEKTAQKVQDETKSATAAANLPARGEYSRGATMNSIIQNPRVQWSGYTGEIGLGFDKTKRGAGGFLITGTPRMAPDYALEKIYGDKKYERDLKKDIDKSFKDAIDRYMSG